MSGTLLVGRSHGNPPSRETTTGGIVPVGSFLEKGAARVNQRRALST
jgi:hypothetical protein